MAQRLATASRLKGLKLIGPQVTVRGKTAPLKSVFSDHRPQQQDSFIDGHIERSLFEDEAHYLPSHRWLTPQFNFQETHGAVY